MKRTERDILGAKELSEETPEASSAFAASYVPALGYDQVSKIIRDYEPEEAIRELKKRCAMDNNVVQ